jgi:hypothetical protein
MKFVARHTAEELGELEKRVQAAGRVREPIRLVFDTQTGEREIIDGLGRWEVARRTNIEPKFEDVGADDDVDVAAVILDFATRRNISAEQKVEMYLELYERSRQWMRDQAQARARASAARSEKAQAQPRAEDGHFGAKPAGAVSGETRPVTRERDRIAAATGTSPSTVSRVLATRKGARRQTSPGRKLCDLMRAAVKSLASAAELANTLNASEIADELQRARDQAHDIGAKVDAMLAATRTVERSQSEPRSAPAVTTADAPVGQ